MRAIEAHDEDFVKSYYPERFWLPVAEALRWCADKRIEPKRAWTLAAPPRAEESASPYAPKEVASKPNSARRYPRRREAPERERVKKAIIADLERGHDPTAYSVSAAKARYETSDATFIDARNELEDSGELAKARELGRVDASKGEQ